MDRLEAMTFLVATVEAGSFSAAGRRLGVPLPTVSRRIGELEDHLKARLLVRSTRALALTDAGAAYLARCKSILEQVAETERAAGGEYDTPRGELVMTAPIVFGRLHLLPIVNAFLASHPEIAVRLVLSDRNLQLVDEHIDVALRIGALADSSMVATQVGTVSRVVCGSPDYFLRHGMPQTPAELADHACVNCEAESPAAVWSFRAAGRRLLVPITVRPRLSVTTAEAAMDAAMAGVGLTHVLSYQAAQAVEQGRLQLALRAHEPEPLPVNLLHTGQKPLPLKTRSFIEFAAERLRTVLAGDTQRLRAREAPAPRPARRPAKRRAKPP